MCTYVYLDTGAQEFKYQLIKSLNTLGNVPSEVSRERERGEHVLMYMYMYLSFIRSQLMSLLKVMNNMSQNQTGQLKPYILIHKLKAALNGVCLAWPYLQPFNYVPLLY